MSALDQRARIGAWKAVILSLLALLCSVLGGCSSIGVIKLQGAYVMGEGSEHREIRAAATFKLRDPYPYVRRGDGKTLALSPAEPNCAGGAR